MSFPGTPFKINFSNCPHWEE